MKSLLINQCLLRVHRSLPGFRAGPLSLAVSTFCMLLASPVFALDEGVVATVNGEPVNKSIVNAVVRQFQGRQQAPEEAQIVNELVNMSVLAQLATDEGLHEGEDIQSMLQLHRLQLLANAYMEKLSVEMDVPDEQLKAEYDAQVAKINVPEYRASQILLDSEVEALDVMQKAIDGGSFDDLAKTRSIDPSGKSGGDLGWFQADAMPPEFGAALAKLEPGEIALEPVKTEYGWHVLRLDERRGTPVPEFESVKPQIRSALVTRLLQGKISELRDQADIVLGN